LTARERNVVIAAYLGWTLDAFDFFLMVFMFKDIAADLHSSIQGVSTAVLLTLAMRPIGAFVFGRLADRVGRKPTLMWNILIYSFFEMISGFAPNMSALLVMRALFGIAMGGEWGVGSALTMETIPASARGFVSGLLQVGYPSGYFLASIAVFLFYDRLGWRYMFVLGVVPALLVYFIRRGVEESPAWRETRNAPRLGVLEVVRRHWKIAAYSALLMAAFNFFSHGSQDAYPNLFLKGQHHFDTRLSSFMTGIANLGAICGGLCFGALSQRIGRRRAILIASLLALPAVPFWAFGTTPLILGAGAFFVQVAVQGAWGVIPVHLNELAPAEIRGTFGGFVYQLGNLLAASNLNLQVAIAEAHANDYGLAMAIVVATVAIVIAVMVSFGPERHGISMAVAEPQRPPGRAGDLSRKWGAAASSDYGSTTSPPDPRGSAPRDARHSDG
jgi:SHS family lactate transporter-like MFS transporter